MAELTSRVGSPQVRTRRGRFGLLATNNHKNGANSKWIQPEHACGDPYCADSCMSGNKFQLPELAVVREKRLDPGRPKVVDAVQDSIFDCRSCLAWRRITSIVTACALVACGSYAATIPLCLGVGIVFVVLGAAGLGLEVVFLFRLVPAVSDDARKTDVYLENGGSFVRVVVYVCFASVALLTYAVRSVQRPFWNDEPCDDGGLGTLPVLLLISVAIWHPFFCCPCSRNKVRYQRATEPQQVVFERPLAIKPPATLFTRVNRVAPDGTISPSHVSLDTLDREQRLRNANAQPREQFHVKDIVQVCVAKHCACSAGSTTLLTVCFCILVGPRLSQSQ